MTEPLILSDRQGTVRRITLNRPEKMNAINQDMLDLFFATVDEAVADDETRVIVLSGAGRAFSPGWDVKSIPADGGVPDAAGDMATARAIVDRWLCLWSISKPLIGQIHGYCLGMANDLLACCDMVICGESTRIGMPEVREFALPPTLGFWPMKVGLLRAKELLWTGRLVDGHEAVALGLANQVVADGELSSTVDALAAHIAEVKPSLLAVSKQATNAWWETFGLRAAALRGADYHSIFHQSH
jgi:enoyl-CoA hydratase